MKLDKATAVAVVALAVIVGAFALGVLALTPVELRGALLDRIGGPVGTAVAGLVAAVGSLIAARSAHTAKQETRAQTDTLDKVAHNTNGALTKRLDDTRQGITDDVLAALREAGVLPTEGAPVEPAELAPVEPIGLSS